MQTDCPMRMILVWVLFLLLPYGNINAMDYVHKEQYVDYKWDQYKVFGKVNLAQAIIHFNEYPFESQLTLAVKINEPTFPTISFECDDDGSVLAIWSLKLGEFEVYHKSSLGKQFTIETQDTEYIQKLIGIYFSGDRKAIEDSMIKDGSVVIASGFWSKLKGLVVRRA